MNVVVLALVVAANVGGQLLFKIAADQVRDETGLLSLAQRLIANPAMWGAVILYGVTIFAWVWVLRTMPLSEAYSAVSLVFVAVPLLAAWLFREPVTPTFVFGSVLIVVGVCIVQVAGSLR